MPRVVELEDKAPLVIKKEEMDDDVVAVCRCGLSANWPFCDGAHSHTENEDGELYAYEKNNGSLEPQRLDEEPGTYDPRS